MCYDTRSAHHNVLTRLVVHCTIGRGAVLNEHAVVENEAAVMDGTTMRTGAVCGRK